MKNAGKILVTGATGNVGSLLIPNLANLGADVRALTRDETKAQGLKDAGVEVVVGNVELQKKLDGFRANAEADIDFKTAQDNEALRIKNTGVEERALKVGQRAPDFELSDFEGNQVSLAQLRANGPLALIFYRGLWCAYCNMEQLALQEIYPEIRKIGAQLAAITPGRNPLPADHPLAQVAAKLGVGPEGDGRTFPVLWDEGNRVADSFGLKHDFSDASRDMVMGVGLDMEEINGAEAGWTLPLASTYIIDKAGLIRHAVVTADWRIRTDPNDTLERLRQVAADQ